MKDSQGS